MRAAPARRGIAFRNTVYGVAPVISLADVISVVYEYRNEHNHGADGKCFDKLFIKLCVKQLDGFGLFF